MSDPLAPPLHADERGGEGTPIILLHGFGGDHRAWGPVRLSLGARPSLAFDLPGHGASLHHPVGNARAAAASVLAELARRGHGRVHLVGHSFGGAVAALAALAQPARVASLTLLAPGGFGPEIDHRLLRDFAAATAEAEIEALLRHFFSPDHPPPRRLARHLAQERRDPRVTRALRALVALILDGERQGVLPRERLATLGLPVMLVWGEADRVLPPAQARGLPPEISVRPLDGLGHMLHIEVPAVVARLILENASAARLRPPRS